MSAVNIHCNCRLLHCKNTKRRAHAFVVCVYVFQLCALTVALLLCLVYVPPVQHFLHANRAVMAEVV